MQVHAGSQLQRAANEVTGRRGGVGQATGFELFTRGEHAGNRRGAGLDDRAHGFFDDVGQAAFFVAGRGVGAAVGAAALQISVVPGHLADHGLGHFRSAGARGQLVNAVTHLSGFRKHHAGAGTHQQVGAKADRRVGGDAGKSVAAAALHAHHQL